MKTLKSIFILSLFFALAVSCTAEELTDESIENQKEFAQATGDETEEVVDETEKP